jgi:predicted metal-binding membrane protein
MRMNIFNFCTIKVHCLAATQFPLSLLESKYQNMYPIYILRVTEENNDNDNRFNALM